MSIHPTHGPRRIVHTRRDHGVTLIEMVLSITLIGIVMGSVTAAAIVLFRNTGTTTERVATAQDTRQLVNYFPGDVRSADIVEVHEPAISAASVCPGVPSDSALHLELTSELTSANGRTRTEYRSSVSAGSASLHRWTCTLDETGAVSGPARRVRIGDDLDPARPVSMQETRDDDRVQITLEMRWLSGATELSATPFAEDPAPPPPPPAAEPPRADPPPPGVCPASPMPLTRGFTVMTAGDVWLHNQAGDFYGPIAVGGDLTFKNARVATQSAGAFMGAGGSQPSGLVAGGRIDWDRSGGGFLEIARGDLHMGDMGNWTPANGAGRNELRLTDDDGPQNRQVRVLATDQSVESVSRPGLLPFDSAFESFREISSGLTTLPGSCHGVTELELLGPDGVGEWSGGDVWLSFTPGFATVLTMTMAEYASMGNVNLANGSATPARDTPLIITITDSGVVRMPQGETNISRNHVPHVLWNFPNAERVVTTGTFWGGILAPFAVVEQHGDIRGNVIAAGLETHRGIISLQTFDGVFPWAP